MNAVFLKLPGSETNPSRRMRVRSLIRRRGCAGQGVVKINSQTRSVRTGERRRSENAQVRREIENFLQALHSYPDRFARDPRVTFEEHHGGLVRAAMTESRRRA